MFSVKAKCPRCGKIWMYPQGSPGDYCDCHLYCKDGDKQTDCSVTEYNYTGDYGSTEHRDTDSNIDYDDLLHITGYCSTHGNYIHKAPIFIDVDEYALPVRDNRLSKKYRQ